VVDVDIATRRVAVGPAHLLELRTIRADRASWCGPAPTGSGRLGVQVRAHGAELPAVVECGPDWFVAELEAPTRGVAPGQAAVLYEGTRVVGSGTIAGR
jgi:tRNA-specific 2-thiouridylase